MPQAPRRPCRSPGCRELVQGSYCAAHERKKEVVQREARIKYDNERGTAHARGYGSRWTAYSKRYRQEHPLCVVCERNGKLKLTECVDHIVPVSGPDDPLFWEPSNHQSLCGSCHSEKTAKEDGGFGNVRTR